MGRPIAILPPRGMDDNCVRLRMPCATGTLTRAELREVVRVIEAHLGTRPPERCEWSAQDGGPWSSECGVLFLFEDDGPSANDFRFCPGCGKPLAEREEAPRG